MPIGIMEVERADAAGIAEVEHSGVERQRAVHVGHRERDRTDRGDRGRPGRQRGALVGAGLLGWERRGAERQRQDGEARELHCKRSRMWLPTRSALAMMVRAGFTAPLEGKKLPSTTYRLSSSCALQLRSSAEVSGSFPNRMVPFWRATPASGIP